MFPGYQINLRNNANLKQQPLKGEIFKIFGKGGEPYMGGLNNPLETLMRLDIKEENDVAVNGNYLFWPSRQEI